MARRRRVGAPRKRRRNYKREYEMSQRSDKQPVGAPIGSQNGLSHGIVAFKNGVKRRARKGRSLIDRRTVAGQNAFAVRQKMLVDLGGESNLSTAKLMLIEMVARDTYFLDECDRRIFKTLYKLSSTEKALLKLGKVKNPKVIGVMYTYRASIARNLASNLLALGLEKAPPKQKSLQEIIAESENGDTESQGESHEP